MNKIQKMIKELCPNGVEWKKLGEVCKLNITHKKLKTKEYKDKGKYPIVDQGQKFIVGYTDDNEGLLTNPPYICFGDHTRELKYIDFPFVQGGDGLKFYLQKIV